MSGARTVSLMPSLGRPHPRRPAVCVHCGADFMALTAEVRKGGGRFCSTRCCGDHAKATGSRAGANNPRWQGGISKAPGANMKYRRRTIAKYPERVRAREKVAYAVRWGHLRRQPCEACGAPKAAAHHDDYSKPLEVRWLCRPCHDTHHAAERQQASEQ
jgi:ribosomal protein S27AE